MNDCCYFCLQLNIQISDINDNRPVCPVLPEIQLNRQVSQGHVVTQLEVTDADIGQNAVINYLALRQGSNVVDPLFNVNPSGDIITLR